MNYYELLQVAPGADREVIRAAFRTIMSKLNAHPDRGGDPARARQLIEAWQTLSDDQRRQEYDRRLELLGDGTQAGPARREAGRGTGSEQPQVRPMAPRAAASGLRAYGREVEERAAMQEVRGLDRVSIERRVHIDWNGRQTSGTLVDLSPRGARLSMQMAVEPGVRLEVRLSPRAAIFGLAEVVHVVRPGREYGLRWLKLYEEQVPTGLVTNLVA